MRASDVNNLMRRFGNVSEGTSKQDRIRDKAMRLYGVRLTDEQAERIRRSPYDFDTAMKLEVF